MRRLRALIAVAAALALLASSETGRADERHADEARRLFARANELVDAGNLPEALATYRAAYELEPRPSLLLNIGVVADWLERLPDAANAFAQLLEHEDATAEHRARATAELARLDVMLGVLELDIDVVGAFVRLDGDALGMTPLTTMLRVRPGRHVVVVEGPAAGQRQTLSADVAAGSRERIVVHPATPRVPPQIRREVVPAAPKPELRVTATERAGAVWRSSVHVHFDVRTPGAVAAPGVARSLGRRVWIGATALIGANRGFEVGMRATAWDGAIRPSFTVAAPVFVAGGIRPGARASVGMVVALPLGVMLSVEAGGAFVPSVPDGADRAAPLVSVGMERGL